MSCIESNTTIKCAELVDDHEYHVKIDTTAIRITFNPEGDPINLITSSSVESEAPTPTIGADYIEFAPSTRGYTYTVEVDYGTTLVESRDGPAPVKTPVKKPVFKPVNDCPPSETA